MFKHNDLVIRKEPLAQYSDRSFKSIILKLPSEVDIAVRLYHPIFLLIVVVTPK
jgi:hypothetical protein